MSEFEREFKLPPDLDLELFIDQLQVDSRVKEILKHESLYPGIREDLKRLRDMPRESKVEFNSLLEEVIANSRLHEEGDPQID